VNLYHIFQNIQVVKMNKSILFRNLATIIIFYFDVKMKLFIFSQSRHIWWNRTLLGIHYISIKSEKIASTGIVKKIASNEK
jgi:hypothetical protein